jgi:GT2 family glycosyltransferase
MPKNCESMRTLGLGLVAYKISESEIVALSNSIGNFPLSYKVVVDNSPMADAKDLFEQLEWIYFHNPENPGFGASHNFIFENFARSVDYHLIVNPDISFNGHVLKHLVDFMNLKTDAGCVMPKVFYPDGRIQRLAKLLPSPKDLFVRRVPFGSFWSKIIRDYELHEANYDSGIFKVPFLSGCFLMFRVESILKINFFDERFFMYAEDIDLCRRLWANKSFPYYYGLTSVVHGYARGSSKSLQLFIIHLSSAMKYFNKWGWFDRRRLEVNISCLSQFRKK